MKKIITFIATLACLTAMQAQTPVPVPQLYDFNTPSNTVPYPGFTVVGGEVHTNYQHSCDCTRLASFEPDSNVNEILILPPFEAEANMLTIGFIIQWRPAVNNPLTDTIFFDAGYLTNIADTTTFVPIATYSNIEAVLIADTTTATVTMVDECFYHEVPFSNVPNNVRIALRMRGSIGQGNLWGTTLPRIGIDDVEVFKTSNCSRPQEINVSNLTTTSAIIDVQLDSVSTGCWLKLNDSVIGAITTPYSINNLTPNTEYSVYAYSLCATDSSHRFVRAQFRTPCPTFPAPWTDDFESYADSTLPCYDILLSPMGLMVSEENYPQVVTTTANNTSNGEKALKLYGCVGTPQGIFNYGGDVFVLPTVDLAADQMHVSFKYKLSAITQSGANGLAELRAGVVTQRNDISTFIPYLTINAADSLYHEYDFYTSDLGYDTVYAAFIWASDHYGVNFTPGYLDELRIERAGCRTPDTLFFDSIATNLIAMHWQPRALSYDLAYNTVNDSNSAMMVWTDDTAYTLNGLAADTKYYFWIRSHCQSDSSAWRYLGAVRTACPESFDPPYTENFADYDPFEPPHCWSQVRPYYSSSGYSYPLVDGDQYAIFYPHLPWQAGFGGAPEELITVAALPYINLAYNNMWIRAVGHVDSEEEGILEIGYMTDINNDSTFVPLDTITETVDTEHEILTSSLPYHDSIWVAFRGNRNWYNAEWTDVYLKSIDVREIPYCIRPHEVILDTVGHIFATLSWTDMGASSYEVGYATTDNLNAPDFQLLSTPNTTLTLNNLSPLTTYYTWVRSSCNGDSSIWRRGPSFTTLYAEEVCTIRVTVTDGTPYNTGFDVTGFGWGVDVYSGNVLLASVGNGETDTNMVSADVTVSPHQSLTFTFRTTSQNNRFAPSIDIADISGMVWHPSAMGMATGDTLLTITNPCPSCLPVQDLQLADVSHDYLAVSWTPANAVDSSWIVMLDSMVVDTVNTPEYSFNGLTPNTSYTVTILTLCTDELSYSRSLAARTDCPTRACPIEIVYMDPFGWGSMVANGLEVWTGNDLIATIVSTATSLYWDGDGPVIDTNIRICGTDSIRINQILNGMADATFGITIINGDGDTVSSSPMGEPYVSDTFALQCPCAPPEVRRTEATYNTLTITWHGLDSIELVLCEGAFNDSTGTSIVTAGGSHTFTGLQPATAYSIGLRDFCGSEWFVVSDTTEIAPCFAPDSLTVLGVGFTEATLQWHPVGEETSWEVEATGVGDTLHLTSNTPQLTMQQLYSNTTYTARVRALCGIGSEPESEWGESVQFTTDLCPPVSGLTLDEVTHNSASLHWAAAQSSIGYVLYYGLQGWTNIQAEATTVETVSPNYTITNLDDSTAYDLFVLNRCTETVTSVPSEEYRFTFVTLSTPAGIYDVTHGTLSLYPNPTKQKVVVTVEGMWSAAMRVEIVDMNGRIVYSDAIRKPSFTLDVSTWARGSYFVRIVGDHQTAVRKLVVR